MGKQGQYFEQCYNGNFIGVSFGIDKDLTNDLFDNWRDFNAIYVDHMIEEGISKSRIGAGVSCGAIWTLSKGIEKDAIVICPDLDGNFLPCKIVSNYCYEKGDDPYHRRKVEWFKNPIKRSDMSKPLLSSLSAQNTLIDISPYSEEIESLIHDDTIKLHSNDPTIEEPSEFALEKHLEEFLIKNWKKTDLGKEYDIYEEDGILIGQQYQSDTGPIDILAISKDKKTLLVVELKKGRVSDNVVGQIQRYMGFVKEDLAENQNVKGVIIGHDDDVKIQRALSVTNNIEFYKYKVNFKLYQ